MFLNMIGHLTAEFWYKQWNVCFVKRIWHLNCSTYSISYHFLVKKCRDVCVASVEICFTRHKKSKWTGRDLFWLIRSIGLRNLKLLWKCHLNLRQKVHPCEGVNHRFNCFGHWIFFPHLKAWFLWIPDWNKKWFGRN